MVECSTDQLLNDLKSSVNAAAFITNIILKINAVTIQTQPPLKTSETRLILQNTCGATLEGTLFNYSNLTSEYVVKYWFFFRPLSFPEK